MTNGSLDVSFGGVSVDGSTSSLVTNGYVGIGNNTSLWGGVINLNNNALFHAASTTDNLVIGSLSGVSGSLYVTGGSLLTADGNVVVGEQVGSSGVLQVDGASQATLAQGLRVGWQGTGTVSINSAGSKLSANGYTSIGDMGMGSMTLTNTADFTAGDIVVLGLNTSGAGSLVVNSGSTVTTAKDMQVGWQGTGALTVDGAGSTLQVVNGGLFAGWKGTGTIDITNGGTINTTGWGAIGDQVGGHGAMTIDGTGSQFNLVGGLNVGNQGSGTLDITNGGTATTTGWGTQVGGAAGSSGTVTVDGPGSSWNNTGDLLVGWAGTGSLAVSNGGALSTHVLTVGGDFASGVGHGTLSISSGGTINSYDGLIGNSSGSSGVVTVDGIGSTWNISTDLEVGLSGTGSSGSLDITNGGAVTVGSSMGIGLNGSTGAVTVDGAGSSLDVLSGIVLGYASTGPGTLAITNGGSVSTTYGVIAGSAGSMGSVTVDGAGSTWSGTGDLQVGSAGNGSLAITHGGVVSSGSSPGYTTSIGTWAGGLGTVTVDGSGSKWTTTDHLIVGEAGTGSLVIKNDGEVSAASVTIAANSGSSGTLTVDGGTLNTTALSIGTGGVLTFDRTGTAAGSINATSIDNAGQFTVNTAAPVSGAADARTIGGSLHNGATGTVAVKLQDNAAVTFTGPVTNDGLFKVTQLPGTSGGVTTFTGAFTNNGSFIQDPTTTHFAELFNAGYFEAGDGDQVIVDGGFHNDGHLNLTRSLLSTGAGLSNDGIVDIFGGADIFGDYSGTGSLQLHIGSATDRLIFNAGFTGSLELIFDPGYLLTGTENFLYFSHGAFLTELLIGGISYGSNDYAGAGFLSGSGTFIPASSVPDTAGTLGLLSVSLLALAAFRRRAA